jgi:hypothetical protein
MALTFFEPKESTGNGDTPFLNEWLDSNPKNKQDTFLVREILRVQSGKGYRVVCDSFQAFIWNNAKITKLLLEALEIWINDRENGYALYIVLSKPTKPEFSLACDKDEHVSWFSSKNGYTTMESSALSKEASIVERENPFL